MQTDRPTGPLPFLRSATRAHHDRIDHLMDLRRLAEPARYRRVLQVFGAFLPAWEAAVSAALPASRRDWLARRSRLGFLAADLQVLGVGPLTGIHIAPFRDAAAAWGSVYVVEGSALGGQVITRALADAGLHPHSGAAYFHGWGSSTGAMWREFRELLETELQGPDALPSACEGARETFDTLSALLEGALDECAAAC